MRFSIVLLLLAIGAVSASGRNKKSTSKVSSNALSTPAASTLPLNVANTQKQLTTAARTKKGTARSGGGYGFKGIGRGIGNGLPSVSFIARGQESSHNTRSVVTLSDFDRKSQREAGPQTYSAPAYTGGSGTANVQFLARDGCSGGSCAAKQGTVVLADFSKSKKSSSKNISFLARKSQAPTEEGQQLEELVARLELLNQRLTAFESAINEQDD